MASIDVRIGHEIIDTPLESPGPGSDGAAIGRITLGGIVLGEPGIKTGAGLRAVGIDIPIIEDGQSVTAPDDFSQGPVTNLGSASGLSSGVVCAVFAIVA